MPSLTNPARSLVAAAAVTALLAACSGTEDETPSTPQPSAATSSVTPSSATKPSASTTPKKEPKLGPLLSVSIDGEEVLPNAEEIDLSTGEKLLIEIESDRAGELHVHSTPEQFIEFAAGTTQTELVIETPGSVEVEDHDTGAVVALIQAR